ncbi:hypothetical protein [Escherichia coli]|uniref:type IV pilus biogenesis protein PilI n=1 Tax=Escherichia coli TaxID=562 RepID=UPI00207860B0|nr:hypothetical protein [Escherichia coli]
MSIKNDGHYFCRAGGNRPDGLNEPVTINITSLTFKNSLLAARILMVPENYMICILRNGERVRRWDREILAGSNRWYKCSPDNFEILGKLPIINKVTTLIKS